MDYDWSQFVAFSAAVGRSQKQKMRDLFAVQFTAARGDQDAINRLFKELED